MKRPILMETELLELSLEAIGLAAHILSFEDDEVDEEFLRGLFPDRDLAGPLRELASVGLVEIAEHGSLATPLREPDNSYAAAYRQPGTIYLVEAGGRFKVGITRSMSHRRRQLQSGCPFKLRVVHTALVKDSRAAELCAHRLLARFHAHGEWFVCTEEQALDAVKAAVDRIGGVRS